MEFNENGQVAVIFSGTDAFLYSMIPRDDEGIGIAHELLSGLGREAFVTESLEPVGEPLSGGWRVPDFDEKARGCRISGGGCGVDERVKSSRKIGTLIFHQLEQAIEEVLVVRMFGSQAEFGALNLMIGLTIGDLEGLECGGGFWDGIGRILCAERQETFCEAREVPERDGRLIGERIAAPGVDVTEPLHGVVFIKKRAGAEVEGLTGDGGVVCVHDAVDESDAHPLCDEAGLHGADLCEEGEVAIGGLEGVASGVMTSDDVFGEDLE